MSPVPSIVIEFDRTGPPPPSRNHSSASLPRNVVPKSALCARRDTVLTSGLRCLRVRGRGRLDPHRGGGGRRRLRGLRGAGRARKGLGRRPLLPSGGELLAQGGARPRGHPGGVGGGGGAGA